MSSGLSGYLTSSGTDLSNVFMNIDGITRRRSGTGNGTINIYVSSNVPVLIGIYIEDATRSGMCYLNALYNSDNSALYMSYLTYVPPSPNSPFSSVIKNTDYITVTPLTSNQTINWFEMKLNMSDTGLITNELDLTKIFKNINGYSTHSSGSYFNYATSQTITIPSANIPYKFVAYDSSFTAMINAYVYHTTTTNGGGIAVISYGGGTTLFSTTPPTYNIVGTITLNTTQTNASRIIYYNFNTLY